MFRLTIFIVACFTLRAQSLILDNKHTQRYDGEVNIGEKFVYTCNLETVDEWATNQDLTGTLKKE